MAYQSIVTGIVRMSRMHLTPNENASQRKKFKATILLPKSDTITWQKINNAINDAIGSALKKVWRNTYLENIQMPIKDGDGTLGNNIPYTPECAGNYLISVSSSSEPVVVDKNFQHITKPDAIYDGIYACVALQFYPLLNKNNSPFIGCTLGAVMKISDGEFIPWHVDPVWLEFAKIAGVKPPKFSPGKSSTKDKDEKKSSIVVPVIDTNNPPWEDENFKALVEVMKNRKVSLDELKQFADSQNTVQTAN